MPVSLSRSLTTPLILTFLLLVKPLYSCSVCLQVWFSHLGPSVLVLLSPGASYGSWQLAAYVEQGDVWWLYSLLSGSASCHMGHESFGEGQLQSHTTLCTPAVRGCKEFVVTESLPCSPLLRVLISLNYPSWICVAKFIDCKSVQFYPLFIFCSLIKCLSPLSVFPELLNVLWSSNDGTLPIVLSGSCESYL